MNVLSSEEIARHLTAVPSWTHQVPTIRRTFELGDFHMSIAFVRRIAKRADKLHHHRDIGIRFDQVALTLTTHDRGGLTAKDFTLDQQCDEVFSKCSKS